MLAFRTLTAALFALTLGSAAGAQQLDRLKPAHGIVWGKTITLTPPDGAMGRYPRLVEITKGSHAGDMLLTYETEKAGGDFGMYRSRDGGQTWDGPTIINRKSATWDYANCNIIQLSDGRLLMTQQRRVPGGKYSKDGYIDIRFSSDGGETWTAPRQIFNGGNWEGRPVEVPNDANGDGTRDIYLFYTQTVIDTTTPADQSIHKFDHGRAIAFIASYDGGATWSDRNPERFTGQIIHRDYDEDPVKSAPSERSAGGMPQPFLLPNNRLAIIVEELEMKESPIIFATDPGDWDWQGKDFQGAWTSADYIGIDDNNVYPTAPDNAWPATPQAFGKGPYASVLPDGRVIMTSRNQDVVTVWIGDKTGHNFKFQELPFGRTKAAYPFVEPIGGNQILVAGGSAVPGDNFILLRFGTVK